MKETTKPINREEKEGRVVGILSVTYANSLDILSRFFNLYENRKTYFYCWFDILESRLLYFQDVYICPYLACTDGVAP